MKSWLQDNDIEMHSTCNEEKSVYIDKLDYVVNKYNYTYDGAIKMEPVYVKVNHIF